MEQLDPEQQRIKEQADLERKWLVIPMKIMADKRLTLADKVIYGRAFFFDEFFESKEHTAEILGISVNQVKISKRKLEELGLIKCIKNDGRGKRYVAILQQQGRGSKSDPQRVKKCPSEGQNLTPENKAENKAENSSFSKEKEAPEAPASEDSAIKDEKPSARFGNAQVNEFLDEWEEATGFDWHGTRQERFAAKNLIAKYGSEATKALVRRVKRARRSDDQFAPQIAKPSQLVGKYEKLTALIMWEERQAKREAEEIKHDGPDFSLLYPALEPDPEPEDYSREYSPEEQKRRHKISQALREKYGFKKQSEED